MNFDEWSFLFYIKLLYDNRRKLLFEKLKKIHFIQINFNIEIVFFLELIKKWNNNVGAKLIQYFINGFCNVILIDFFLMTYFDICCAYLHTF